jgi:hypothetical protein
MEALRGIVMGQLKKWDMNTSFNMTADMQLRDKPCPIEYTEALLHADPDGHPADSDSG